MNLHYFRDLCFSNDGEPQEKIGKEKRFFAFWPYCIYIAAGNCREPITMENIYPCHLLTI